MFAGFALFPLLMRKSHKPRTWPEHTFPLAESPGSLTQEFAIAKAYEALRLDGLSPDLWLVATNGCELYSNQALVNLYTRGVSPPCFVRVELKSNQVVCQVTTGGGRE